MGSVSSKKGLDPPSVGFSDEAPYQLLRTGLTFYEELLSFLQGEGVVEEVAGEGWDARVQRSLSFTIWQGLHLDSSLRAAQSGEPFVESSSHGP